MSGMEAILIPASSIDHASNAVRQTARGELLLEFEEWENFRHE
jgi:hypothetical protein